LKSPAGFDIDCILKNFGPSFSSTALFYDCVIKLGDGGGAVTYLGPLKKGDLKAPIAPGGIFIGAASDFT